MDSEANNNQEQAAPIFGAVLEDAVRLSHIPGTLLVPTVLHRCAEFLEAKGVYEVGLYRHVVCGIAGSKIGQKCVVDSSNDEEEEEENEGVEDADDPQDEDYEDKGVKASIGSRRNTRRPSTSDPLRHPPSSSPPPRKCNGPARSPPQSSCTVAQGQYRILAAVTVDSALSSGILHPPTPEPSRKSLSD